MAATSVISSFGSPCFTSRKLNGQNYLPWSVVVKIW